MQKRKGGKLEAEFLAQISGPGLPTKIRVARGAAQVDVNYLTGSRDAAQPIKSSTPNAPDW